MSAIHVPITGWHPFFVCDDETCKPYEEHCWLCGGAKQEHPADQLEEEDDV